MNHRFRKLVLVPIDEASTITRRGGGRARVPSLHDIRDDELNKKSAVEESRKRYMQDGSRARPSNKLITAKLLAIPDKYVRGEALSLLHRLEKNPFIRWDEMGMVTLHGTYLPESNIADLIIFSVYPKNLRDGRRRVVPPAHWEEFNEIVQRVPQSGSGHKRKRCPIHG